MSNATVAFKEMLVEVRPKKGVNEVGSLFIILKTSINVLHFRISPDALQSLIRNFYENGVGTIGSEGTYITCRALSNLEALDINSPEYRELAMNEIHKLAVAMEALKKVQYA